MIDAHDPDEAASEVQCSGDEGAVAAQRCLGSRNVERGVTLALDAAHVEHRVRTGHHLGHRVGEVTAVGGESLEAVDERRLRVPARDHQHAGVRDRRRAGVGGDEQQMDGLEHGHAVRYVDERAIVHEGGVERRERVAVVEDVSRQVLVYERQTVGQRVREPSDDGPVAPLDQHVAVKLGLAGRLRGERGSVVAVYEHQLVDARAGEVEPADVLCRQAVTGATRREFG